MAEEEIVEFVSQARQIILYRDLTDEVADNLLFVPKLLVLPCREIEAGRDINDDANET